MTRSRMVKLYQLKAWLCLSHAYARAASFRKEILKNIISVGHFGALRVESNPSFLLVYYAYYNNLLISSITIPLACLRVPEPLVAKMPAIIATIPIKRFLTSCFSTLATAPPVPPDGFSWSAPPHLRPGNRSTLWDPERGQRGTNTIPKHKFQCLTPNPSLLALLCGACEDRASPRHIKARRIYGLSSPHHLSLLSSFSTLARTASLSFLEDLIDHPNHNPAFVSTDI